MKRKNGFVLRKLSGMNLLIPTGDNIKTFKGTLMLNDTAALVYEGIDKGLDRDAMIARMTAGYDVAADKAAEGVDKAIKLLMESGVVE